jgi:hypothetical protein
MTGRLALRARGRLRDAGDREYALASAPAHLQQLHLTRVPARPAPRDRRPPCSDFRP